MEVQARLVLHTAEPGSPSEQGLHQLARSATAILAAPPELRRPRQLCSRRAQIPLLSPA